MDKVGEKIYNLRKDKGLSQDKLAEMLCVSRPTISRWENDAVQPTTENIESLCKIFNVDSNYFFDNVDGLAVTKEIDDQDIVESKEYNNGKLKTFKIISIVVGMVLLTFCIIACGIAVYVNTIPDMGGAWTQNKHTINYTAIIFIVVGVLAIAVFITLSVIFIKRYIKNRKNKKL